MKEGLIAVFETSKKNILYVNSLKSKLLVAETNLNSIIVRSVDCIMPL